MSAAHLRLDHAVSPFAAFHELYASDPYGFLCESLGEAGRNRYSFFGGRPSLIHRTAPSGIRIESPATGAVTIDERDFLASVRSVLSRIEPLSHVSPFASGLVGYVGYDIARRFERLPSPPPDPERLSDSVFMVPSEIVIVDHENGVTDIVLHHAQSRSRAAQMLEALSEIRPGVSPASACDQRVRLSTRTSRADFENGVRRLLEHIRAGDLFQGVLSRRFEATIDGDPLGLYGHLRETNPAPYMYYLRLGHDHAVLGSSPEVLVTQEGRRALTRPLAGTRPRGSSRATDAEAATELLADPKERAEHVMLVDLARNDLGRVCEYGSVRVTREFEIEKHARVMHIVSEVEGRLRGDQDGLDLLRAVFPAGTVTGAPKIRAMQILDALEPVRRGLYGGAIGYIDAASRMDLCLAIRTIVYHRGRVLLQAGAGVVADSDPSREYEETWHKARAVAQALDRNPNAAAEFVA